MADVDDVLLNVFGSVLGYALFRLGIRFLRAYGDRPRPGTDVARRIVALKEV